MRIVILSLSRRYRVLAIIAVLCNYRDRLSVQTFTGTVTTDEKFDVQLLHNV
jgi:hypothetical protein